MDHEYSHEYMHEHGIPHDHHDDGAHAHDHEHPHGHTHGHDHPAGDCPAASACKADCGSCDKDPRAEVVALMQYMVNHNAAHANELAQLAQKLRQMGDTVACEQVMQAVSDFEKGNMRLSTVLSALNAPRA